MNVKREPHIQDGTENVTGPYHKLILAVSFFSFGIAVSISVVNLLYFGHRTDGQEGACDLPLFFSSFNIVLWVILTVFSFKATEWMPSTGILPATTISAFMTFKVLSLRPDILNPWPSTPEQQPLDSSQPSPPRTVIVRETPEPRSHPNTDRKRDSRASLKP